MILMEHFDWVSSFERDRPRPIMTCSTVGFELFWSIYIHIVDPWIASIRVSVALLWINRDFVAPLNFNICQSMSRRCSQHLVNEVFPRISWSSCSQGLQRKVPWMTLCSFGPSATIIQKPQQPLVTLVRSYGSSSSYLMLLIDGLAVRSLFLPLRPCAQRQVVKQAEKVQSYHTWSGDVCDVNLKDWMIEQQQPMTSHFSEST